MPYSIEPFLNEWMFKSIKLSNIIYVAKDNQSPYYSTVYNLVM